MSQTQVDSNTIYIARCIMNEPSQPLEYRSANPAAIGEIIKLQKPNWNYDSIFVSPVPSHNPVQGHEIRGLLDALYSIPNIPKSFNFSSF